MVSAVAVDPLTLHSNPGADKVIFLDYDGTTVAGDYWQRFGKTGPTQIPGWDPSGDGQGFSAAEVEAIRGGWALVAEIFAPWDVDVTTEDPGAAGLIREDAGDATYGTHVVLTTDEGIHQLRCGACSGISDGVIDTVGEAPIAWVFNGTLGGRAGAGAGAAPHEVGHTLHLDHDGTLSEEYYGGHGNWSPIMGSMGKAVLQWSKGDYVRANNHQDDLAIIGSHLPVRADEAPESPQDAVALPISRAYITPGGDADSYALGACRRGAQVTVTPTTPAPSLDIEARLYDADGSLIRTVNPPSVNEATQGASLSVGVGVGDVLQVRGGSNGDWFSSGWDSYGSIGSYSVEATGCDGRPLVDAPVTVDDVAGYVVDDEVEVSLLAGDDADDASQLETRYTIGTDASAAADPWGGSGTVYSDADKPTLSDGEYISYSSKDTDGHVEGVQRSTNAQVAARLRSTAVLQGASNRVGQTISVATPTVSPAGATLTYQFQRRASPADPWVPIGTDSATATYQLAAADVGSEISVEATVHAAGFRSAQSTSLPTAAVVAAADPGTDGLGGPVTGTFGSLGSGDGQFDYARDVAVDDAGFVYVADEFNSRVQKFTAAGDWVDTWDFPAGPNETDGVDHGPNDGIDIGPDGHVYVFDQIESRVLEYDAYGNLVTWWVSTALGGMTVADDGSIFQLGQGSVQKYDAEGTLLHSWGSFNNAPDSGDLEFNFPTATVVSDGVLYVVDTGNNRIQALDATTGAFVASYAGAALGATLDAYGMKDIEVDADGNFYVLMGTVVPHEGGTDTVAMVVRKFDPDFSLLTTFEMASSDMAGFRLDLAANGQIYVADIRNRVGMLPAAHPLPVAPSGVTAQPHDGYAMVDWTPSPSARRRAITSYTVTANPGGPSVTVEWWMSGPVKVDGLTNGTPYTFSVKATNADGDSVAASSSAITPIGKPVKMVGVTAVAGAGQATVNWTTPPDGGSPITGYEIQFTTPNGSGVRTVNNPAATSEVFNGLTAGQQVSFAVSAINSVGKSPLSAPAVATPYGKPAPPATVTTEAGDAQATVRWTDASANGSPITSYTVTASPGGASKTVGTAVADGCGGCHEVVFSNLTNGTPYTFTVVATNAAGASTGTTSSAVTPVAAPQPLQPTATTTHLEATDSAVQGDPVTLTATVAPSNAAGCVRFEDGSTVLACQPVSAGVASLVVRNLSEGSHTLTAAFVPTNPNQFTGSTSAPVAVTITRQQPPAVGPPAGGPTVPNSGGTTPPSAAVAAAEKVVQKAQAKVKALTAKLKKAEGAAATKLKVQLKKAKKALVKAKKALAQLAGT